MLTYFVRGNVTIKLVSCLTGLVLPAAEKNTFTGNGNTKPATWKISHTVILPLQMVITENVYYFSAAVKNTWLPLLQVDTDIRSLITYNIVRL